MAGRMLGVVDSTMTREQLTYCYIASLVTQTFYVSIGGVNGSQQKVVDISGRVRVAGTGGACTLQVFKVPSGSTVANGTLLHSGTYNLVGTVDTNQQLLLVTDQNALTLNAGDGLGYVLTGTATSAVGVIGVTLEPVAP